MKIRALLFLAAGLVGINGVNAAKAIGEIVSGKPQVVNSTTMIIADKTVKLAHIVSLQPGASCVWKNRPLDCGVLATAGLKDLVAGADVVVCKKATTDKFTCTAGGYDLAYGLIHAGWAVPERSAPARYLKKMNRAKQRKLGFWDAKNSSNKIVAATLSRN